MGAAVVEVFGPGKPGFIVTLLLALTIGEFLVEQTFHSTNRNDRIPFLKAGSGIAAVLILLTYLGILIGKYVTWSTKGTLN
ncbi:hypothetical protein DEAC_c14560 [Desulfosporosinus acididurans]|uniref:Uncharacterized protein n=1 Tax=Desulfosporosinus acididurans TaxID=476652 RepID=A0A0J1FUW4_9FIRM|nr:hypothetical protein [Desulfosporosinus acididurans]KLU66788.1 hypothetical protein DEAC_c14560 [Desulfosporosinus acididurans]